MLKLQTLTPDNKHEESFVELDAEELTKFLKTLKAAQKVNQQLISTLIRSLFQLFFMFFTTDYAFMKPVNSDKERILSLYNLTFLYIHNRKFFILISSIS
jgi:hypothetical protein